MTHNPNKNILALQWMYECFSSWTVRMLHVGDSMVNSASLSTAGQSAGTVDSIILEDALPESLNSIKIFIPFYSVILILGLS